jgi:hypothetical protein
MTPTIIFASIFGVVALLKATKVRYSTYLPSGLAAAVGTLLLFLLTKECTTHLLLHWPA